MVRTTVKAIAGFVLGPCPEGTVPERIRQAMRRQQAESEILIGWAQMALALLFGTLYAVSPKPVPMTLFEPVPWVLGLYFSFTVLRLVLAYRNRLTPAFLMVSVIADVVLLLSLIWTFHLQYEQPPGFYLKAPTLLYVFIFIALRALRFKARYVIAAGLAAAVGWLLMVGYALFAGAELDGTEMVDHITRNYVEYITSNMILIGAEIDKVVSILMVTVILAMVLTRAYRLLWRSVIDHQAAADLTRFVAPEVAARIATSEHGIRAGDCEQKVATVMFTDIEGFSTVSERLRPPELAATLNDYFTAMAEVVRESGGTISQFLGDAMLIGFNTVTADPDHAANALRAAAAIRRVAESRTFGPGVRLRTRCGINTGEIVIGVVGSGDRLIHTMHGDDVNIAARLEPLNKTYGTYVLCAEATIAAAGPGFACRPVGEVTVRGRTQATAVYALDAEDVAVKIAVNTP